jgi:hypothetical protein
MEVNESVELGNVATKQLYKEDIRRHLNDEA